MEDSNELLIGPTNYGRKHELPFYKIFGAAVCVVLAPKGASLCLRRLTVNDVLSHSTNNLCVNDVLSLVDYGKKADDCRWDSDCVRHNGR